MGLRDKVLAADDRSYTDEHIEEWDATVRVRGLSGMAAEEFSRKLGAQKGELPDNLMAELLVRTIEDPETGEPVFGVDDVELLTRKSSRVLTRLFRTAQELSGLGDLDTAKKDSGASQDDGSP